MQNLNIVAANLIVAPKALFQKGHSPTDIIFWTVRVLSVVVVRFARAVWCNIRGGCHHSRAFSFQEVQRLGGLGLVFEGIRRPGPASGVDRPRPVVTDARI